MSYESWVYTIELTNGRVVTVNATRQYIAEGVLHLFYRSGPGVPYEEHAGSWPLTSILSWRRVER